MTLKASNCSALGLLLVALLQNTQTSEAFTVAPSASCSFSNHANTLVPRKPSVVVVYSSEGEEKEPVTEEEKEQVTEDQKEEAVGNLVENDEWEGLTMELSEVIKMAVVEDIKKKTREFTGKDQYQVGDITKEIDSKVKSEIASMRGNEEYQLGDLVVVMDNMVSEVHIPKQTNRTARRFVSSKPWFSRIFLLIGQRDDRRDDRKTLRAR